MPKKMGRHPNAEHRERGTQRRREVRNKADVAGVLAALLGRDVFAKGTISARDEGAETDTHKTTTSDQDDHVGREGRKECCAYEYGDK